MGFYLNKNAFYKVTTKLEKMTLQIVLIATFILVIQHASCMFQFNPTLVPESEVERLAEIEPGSVNSKYFTDASLGIRRVGLSKVRLVCHATAKCPQNNHYINTKSSCHRQGCCYKNGECFQHAWYILKLCPSGSHCKEHCETNNLCNGGTCVAQADSPGYRCTCPYGTCGDNCERPAPDCFSFVKTNAAKPYDEAAALCTPTGTDGRIVSRIISEEDIGFKYLIKLAQYAKTISETKFWIGVKGDRDAEEYVYTETGGNAEGLTYRFNNMVVPDYPRSGEECVYMDMGTLKFFTDSCLQEHPAMCVYKS